MSETASTDGPARRSRGPSSRLALTAIFTALAVALGFLLAPVPNVELVTFTVFAAGVALGRARGALVGALAMAVYSGASPAGSGLAVPPLYAGQILATAFVGFAGGLSSRWWRNRSASALARAATGAAIGFLLTLVYQAAVNVGFALSTLSPAMGLIAAIVANAFFSTVHLVANTVAFGVLAPAVLPRLPRGRDATGPTEEEGS
jgi:hypothetical protein